ESGWGPLQQLLREQAGKKRDAKLNGAGRIQLERLHERGTHTGIVAADVEHPEAAEHVQEAAAVGVVEVLPLRARPDPVEPDRPQDPHELWVDAAGVEVVVLARTRLEELADHRGERNAAETTRAPRLRGSRSSGRIFRDYFLPWPPAFPWPPPFP